LIEFHCDALLFDMDNTLLDSTICNEGIMGRWAEKHGLDRDFVIQVSHGRRTIDSIREAAPYLDAEEEAKEIDAEELGAKEGIVAVPGAQRLLSKLKPYQWAVVTSASRPLATLRMACAGLVLPEVLISGDDVSKGKPSPEGYLKAASRLGVRPERCIVVEDSPAGILAGRHAGMNVVAVTTTFAAEKLLGAPAVANFDAVTFHLQSEGQGCACSPVCHSAWGKHASRGVLGCTPLFPVRFPVSDSSSSGFVSDPGHNL
jgi:sugar-phosphatase